MAHDYSWRNLFFDPFLNHFGPKTAPFQGILGFSWAKPCHHGLKMGEKHLFEHPQMVRDHFWKATVLTHVLPIFGPKRPIFKAFWHFQWPETHPHGLKTG